MKNIAFIFIILIIVSRADAQTSYSFKTSDTNIRGASSANAWKVKTTAITSNYIIYGEAKEMSARIKLNHDEPRVTETKNENLMVWSSESSEFIALSDSKIKSILQDMTQQVRQQVNNLSVEMMLNNLTKQVQDRLHTVRSNQVPF